MIECKICLREFSDGDVGRTPRILTSCGHTLCEECAQKILVGNQITCPFDRNVTALGRTGVKGLPKNFSVLESLREDNQMSNEATMTGIPCAEDSSHDAVFYCQQCEIDLCEICFERIHRPKVFASHQRIDVSEKPLELPKCPMHSLNTAEFICTDPGCKNPEKIMCHVCMTTELHKFHKYDGLRKLIENNKDELQHIFWKTECYYQKQCEKWIQRYTDAIDSFFGEMYQEAEKAIIDKFDEGKKKALEDLRSFSERKVASMKRVKAGFMENLRVMKKLREDVCKKEEMKIIVEIVDEVRRYKELEDNLAMNINKKG
ncbi:unnamed protein product [Caenorhabditis brenneri]